MPRAKKLNTEVDAVTNSTNPEVVVNLVNRIAPLELHVDLGRTDLNDLFRKVEEKVNELVRKANE